MSYGIIIKQILAIYEFNFVQDGWSVTLFVSKHLVTDLNSNFFQLYSYVLVDSDITYKIEDMCTTLFNNGLKNKASNMICGNQCKRFLASQQ